jgi:Cdc6-like AAA superfamily ATPase
MEELHITDLAIKDSTSFIRDAIPDMQDDLIAMRDAQSLQWDAHQLQQHQTIIDWLSPTDFPAQQHDIITRRQEGTGEWFLKSPEFTKWYQGDHKTLFCPGIPGAGKTMMAAIAIDHLCKTVRSDEVGIAYVYCNYNSQGNQSVDALLSAILKQLLQSRPDIAEEAVQLYDSYIHKRKTPTTDEIFAALQATCANYTWVHIVVDALDESSDRDGARSGLVTKLRNLQSRSDIRLMVTSRFIPDIEQEFRSAPKLEVRATDEDVGRYVMGQIPRLPKCIQRDDEMKSLVQTKITEAVDGM